MYGNAVQSLEEFVTSKRFWLIVGTGTMIAAGVAYARYPNGRSERGPEKPVVELRAALAGKSSGQGPAQARDGAARDRHETAIEGIVAESGRIASVRTRGATLKADAYLAALGS
jgi:hypothetical protein